MNHSSHHLQNHQNYQGFTLIEVLIAVVILGLGLLGLAALQASSLRNNNSAYNRSQATQLAYDIADRIRTNRSVAGSYITTMSAVNCSTSASPPTPPTPNCASTTSACTPTQLAATDLYQWKDAMTCTLPSGQGSIALSSAIFTVTINWDDNRDDNVDASDPNFTMSFQL